MRFPQILLLGPFLLAFGCSENESKAQAVQPIPQPSYSENPKPNELAIAEKAFDVFCNACQPLISDNIDEIEKIKVSAWDSMFDYRAEEYGWEKQIVLEVKIKEDSTLFFNRMRVGGHTLHFNLGGPTNPGITTTKFPEVCGVPRNSDGSNVYIPVPSLSFIKSYP